MKPLAKYLTMAEAAAVLGISVQRVNQLQKANKLGRKHMAQVGYRTIAHLERTHVDARKRLAAAITERLKEKGA